MRLKSVLGVAGVILVGAVIALTGVKSRSSIGEKQTPPLVESGETEDRPDPVELVRTPSTDLQQLPGLAVSVAPIQPTRQIAQDEATLMVQLRGLVESDPSRALRLAREGNARFPSGDGAAERGWSICKALTNLQRFDEAEAEAKSMVAKYPGTPWAGDIAKHILINPGTHPTERGYGKQYELE